MSDNPYYSPEENGFTILAEEDFGEDYSSYVFVVLRREADGKLFWDYGSSCSCYSPMDECTIDDLSPLPETLAEFERLMPDKEGKKGLLAAATGRS